MKSTTLVIMAAGIGSRFGGGGIKQLTSFGPCGEIIMDYSIHDAIEAGFDKVVFVIRRSMEKDFKAIIGDRIAQKVKVAYAFQELEDLPCGFTVPQGRTKPWGTGHAILACRHVVQEPFAVINADDYYGKDAFHKVHDYLIHAEQNSGDRYQFCMAGFILENTLSEHGGVTRGICRYDDNGAVAEICETRNIQKTEHGAAAEQENGMRMPVDAKSLVSMNFWGFTPDFMKELESGFKEFLVNLQKEGLQGEQKGEYLLPTIVDRMIKEKRVSLTVLPSSDRWFGVTFKEDVPYVKEAISELIASGKYPRQLKN